MTPHQDGIWYSILPRSRLPLTKWIRKYRSENFFTRNCRKRMVFYSRRIEITARTRQRIKLVFCFVAIFSACVFLVMWFSVEDEYLKMVKKLPGENKRPVSLKKVVFHLDLKGAPPKLSYLRRLLPNLKNHGVNALLIEYEDMFPYKNKLFILSSPHKYPRNEVS